MLVEVGEALQMVCRELGLSPYWGASPKGSRELGVEIVQEIRRVKKIAGLPEGPAQEFDDER